jgi:hypothetical protein
MLSTVEKKREVSQNGMWERKGRARGRGRETKRKGKGKGKKEERKLYKITQKTL